jgi:hypothetical protein
MKTENLPGSSEPVFVEAMDGASYGGASFLDVVEQMRAASHDGASTAGARGYMRQVAKRVWDWSQREVRTANSRVFLMDMAKHGLIKMRVS